MNVLHRRATDLLPRSRGSSDVAETIANAETCGFSFDPPRVSNTGGGRRVPQYLPADLQGVTLPPRSSQPDQRAVNEFATKMASPQLNTKTALSYIKAEIDRIASSGPHISKQQQSATQVSASILRDTIIDNINGSSAAVTDATAKDLLRGTSTYISGWAEALVELNNLNDPIVRNALRGYEDQVSAAETIIDMKSDADQLDNYKGAFGSDFDNMIELIDNIRENDKGSLADRAKSEVISLANQAEAAAVGAVTAKAGAIRDKLLGKAARKLGLQTDDTAVATEGAIDAEEAEEGAVSTIRATTNTIRARVADAASSLKRKAATSLEEGTERIGARANQLASKLTNRVQSIGTKIQRTVARATEKVAAEEAEEVATEETVATIAEEGVVESSSLVAELSVDAALGPIVGVGVAIAEIAVAAAMELFNYEKRKRAALVHEAHLNFQSQDKEDRHALHRIMLTIASFYDHKPSSNPDYVPKTVESPGERLLYDHLKDEFNENDEDYRTFVYKVVPRLNHLLLFSTKGQMPRLSNNSIDYDRIIKAVTHNHTYHMDDTDVLWPSLGQIIDVDFDFFAEALQEITTSPNKGGPTISHKANTIYQHSAARIYSHAQNYAKVANVPLQTAINKSMDAMRAHSTANPGDVSPIILFRHGLAALATEKK